jgi:molybdenum cofactor synthesis domain-containing protein
MRRAVVITVSTRVAAGQAEDQAGPAVVAILAQEGFASAAPIIVTDGIDEVAKAIVTACETADLVVTTGGTGLSPRDLTPEATRTVLNREAPGLGEAMRAGSIRKTPMAMLSRAIAGVRGTSLVVNLPGSPKGAVENLEVLLPILGHALDQIAGGDHPA